MAEFKPSKKVKFYCLSCCKTEEIPHNVIEYSDEPDDGDPSIPLRFNCDNNLSILLNIYKLN